MVAPAIRGLLGIEATDAGRHASACADAARELGPGRAARAERWRGPLRRDAGAVAGQVADPVRSTRAPAGPSKQLVVAPALPLDARVQRVTVNGTVVKHEAATAGDVQRVQILTDMRSTSSRCRVHCTTKVRTCTSSRRICSRARRAMDCGFCAHVPHHGAAPDRRRPRRPDIQRRRADAAPAGTAEGVAVSTAGRPRSAAAHHLRRAGRRVQFDGKSPCHSWHVRLTFSVTLRSRPRINQRHRVTEIQSARCQIVTTVGSSVSA